MGADIGGRRWIARELGLRLGLRSLTLELEEALLRPSTTLPGLLTETGDVEWALPRWTLECHVLPLSLGVRLRGAGGLIARR